jgi:hypothetical protein
MNGIRMPNENSGFSAQAFPKALRKTLKGNKSRIAKPNQYTGRTDLS